MLSVPPGNRVRLGTQLCVQDFAAKKGELCMFGSLHSGFSPKFQGVISFHHGDAALRHCRNGNPKLKALFFHIREGNLLSFLPNAIALTFEML